MDSFNEYYYWKDINTKIFSVAISPEVEIGVNRNN